MIRHRCWPLNRLARSSRDQSCPSNYPRPTQLRPPRPDRGWQCQAARLPVCIPAGPRCVRQDVVSGGRDRFQGRSDHAGSHGLSPPPCFWGRNESSCSRVVNFKGPGQKMLALKELRPGVASAVPQTHVDTQAHRYEGMDMAWRASNMEVSMWPSIRDRSRGECARYMYSICTCPPHGDDCLLLRQP